MSEYLLLAAGGVAGTLARYFLSGLIKKIFSAHLAFGTFTVNLIGCFILGLIVVLADQKSILTPSVRLFLMTGFCGAFTTFSAFIFEVADLTQGGRTLMAFVYILASIGLGLLSFFAGSWLAARLPV